MGPRARLAGTVTTTRSDGAGARLRLFRSFLVDVVLAAAAASLRLHPVYGFFKEHPEVAYWGVGIAHIVIAPFLVMHAFTGGRQARDLTQAGQGPIHGRAYRASFVAALTTSFFVPFLCARALPVAQSNAFSVAVFFAPYVFVALAFAPGDLGLKAFRRTKFLWDTRGGRLVLGVAMTLYLVLMESTMFLCVESTEPARLVVALLGLVLSYLPIRLIVFYGVTMSESRAEVVSLFLSTAFLAAQLVLG